MLKKFEYLDKFRYTLAFRMLSFYGVDWKDRRTSFVSANPNLIALNLFIHSKDQGLQSWDQESKAGSEFDLRKWDQESHAHLYTRRT